VLGDPVNGIDPSGLELIAIGTEAQQNQINSGLNSLGDNSSTRADVIESLQDSIEVYSIEVTSDGNAYIPSTNNKWTVIVREEALVSCSHFRRMIEQGCYSV
jgi:hypothetical protein